MFQGCAHRKPAGDPHLLCDRCCEQLCLPTCTPQSTCNVCEDLTMEVWERIVSARVKRRSRQERQRKTEAAGDDVPHTVTGPEHEEIVPADGMAMGAIPESPPPSPLPEPSQLEPSQELIPTQPAPDLHSEGEIYTSSDSDSELSEISDVKGPPPPEVHRSAREVAREIEFPDLLRWVEAQTTFTIGEPARSKRPKSIRMQSQEGPVSTEQQFVALSCSPAILQFAARRADEFASAANAGHVGFMAPAPKISMRPYQFTSDLVSLTPATHPELRLPWMPQVNARSRSYVRDMDLVVFETLGREINASLSYLDAFLAAISAAANKSQDPDPFTLRAIAASGNILAELAQRSTTIVQHSVIHRRDMFLNGCRLGAEHVANLRLAPYLGAQTLFEPSLLKRVSDEDMEQTKNEALARAIRASSMPSKPFAQKKQGATPKTTPKRPATAMVSLPMSPPPKKAKSSAPAALGSPATTPRSSKKYR